MARVFDRAASEYLRYTLSAPVSGPPFTMACRFRSVSATVTQDLMSMRALDGDTYEGYWLACDGNVAGDPVRFGVYDGATSTVDTTTGYSTSTWHHACGIAEDGTNRSVFIDGGSKNTVAVARAPGTIDDITIGASYGWTGGANGAYSFLDGAVAEAAIWRVALTDLEVHLLYRGYPPWLIRPRDLVGFWLPFGKFVDRDYMPYGRHMDAINTPTWTNQDPHRVTSFRARAQFEPFASSRRRMSYGRYPGNLITRPWAYAPAAPVGGNPWYAYAQQ